jgi:hypothetical protein
MKTPYTPLLMAWLGLGALVPTAHAQFTPDIKFSGFGTVAAVRTNTDAANFGHDRQSYGGANTNATLDVDSNLGLQVNASATSWLSGTVQLLTIKRQTERHLTTEAEWGFVKVAPIEGLSIRAGRLGVPMFLVSDSRNIGYANNWLRAPDEVYGLVSFRRLQGFDVTYQMPIGSNTLTLTVLSGTSATKYAKTNIRMKGVRGANAQLETDWGTFRFGRVEAKYDTAASQAYSFTGVGMTIDRNNVFVQAEYVQKRAPQVSFAEANGHYVMAGYRFGNMLPYVSIAGSKPVTVAANNTSGNQKTTALGLRWDAFKVASVKFQLERIDTDGTKGVSFTGKVPSPVTALSAGVDFVF